MKVESVTIKENGIDINERSLSVDGTVTLTAEVLPANTTDADRVVTWSSSDVTKATVTEDGGVVTGVAVGEATITATTAGLKENGDPATATVKITVTQAVSVESVIIKKDGVEVTTPIDLPANGTLTLTADVSPTNTTDADRVVTWSSSDVTKATVTEDGGVVTGVKEGEVTITAKAAGKDADGAEVKDEVTINITAATVKVESVTIKKDGVEVTTPIDLPANGTLTLTADVSPADAPDEDKVVTWTTGSPAIATVADGVVTWVSTGQATIIATTAGLKENGDPAIGTVTVNAAADSPGPVGDAKLIIFSQAGAPEGTTPAGEVADTDFNANGRLIIKNTSTTSGWGTELSKVAKDTFVYLDTPLTAPFSISARVKITNLIAPAGTDNGIFVGAFTDPKVDNSLAITTGGEPADTKEDFIAIAGVNSATSGRRSVYGTRLNNGLINNSAVGATQFTETYDQEYVYTVTQGTVGTYNILVTDDAFAPSRVHSPYTASGINRSGDTQIYPSLGKAAAGDVAEINNPLYLGIIVSGVEAEISNIIIKQGDTEVYSKPAPATPYPPVQSVSITNEAGTSVEVDGNLRMTASVSPEGAYQGVTWEVDTNDLQYAQIDPTTGTLTGLDIGTAKVYAVSIDNGAGGTPVRSAAFTINITEPEETVREGVFFSWNAATDEALETISNGTSKEINGTPVVVLSKPATAIIEGTKGYSLKDNRFVIGSTSTAATTANDTIVDGTLDLGASFRITIKYASCEGTVFQIYLNNNTGSQGASMLGNASRIWNDEEVPTGGTIEIDVDPSTFTTNNNSLKTGFVSLRADSATTILVTSITLEYLTE